METRVIHRFCYLAVALFAGPQARVQDVCPGFGEDVGKLCSVAADGTEALFKQVVALHRMQVGHTMRPHTHILFIPSNL